ncbi:MAG: uroporphyrinogen-III synthase [Bacteroidota bacterium]
MKRVFVSRKLKPEGALFTYFNLVDSNVSYDDWSMLDFSPVPFDYPNTSWIFFYSQQGVRYFYHGQKMILAERYRVACFAERTAALVKSFGITVDFVGSGDAKEVATNINDKLTHELVTFIHGRASLRSVQHLLTPDFPECIVYDQRMIDRPLTAVYDIAIITSPMNARSFWKNGGKAHNYIAIGPTTASEIQNRKFNCVIAKQPSEKSLVQAVKQFL